jgi:hypothetical protein
MSLNAPLVDVGRHWKHGRVLKETSCMIEDNACAESAWLISCGAFVNDGQFSHRRTNFEHPAVQDA